MLQEISAFKPDFSIILGDFNARSNLSGIVILVSGVTLLFGHLPSRASEIEHFKIFSLLQENQFARRFLVKFNLLLLFLISKCW